MSMSTIGYRHGEGSVELGDRGAVPQKMSGTENLTREPSVPGFPAAVDHVDLRRHTMSLLHLRPSSGLRNIPSRPQGIHESHMASRGLASALPR
jgi:hypothetical protein